MQQTPFELPEYVDAPAPARSVLIIEDDDATANVLATRLSRQGFTTYEAHTGHDGLELASAHHPSLVLLDLGLPDTSGLAVCQSLVDNPATSDIPVIVLSSLQRPDIIRRSRSAGCRALRKYEAAAASLTRILRIRPGDAETLLSLGDVLLMMGRREQARTTWENVRSTSRPDPDVARKASKRLRLYPPDGS